MDGQFRQAPQRRSLALYQAACQPGGATSWSVRSTGISHQEALDPHSSLLSVPDLLEREGWSPTVNEVHLKMLLGQLEADGSMLPGRPLALLYDSPGFHVNGEPLKGPLRDKHWLPMDKRTGAEGCPSAAVPFWRYERD